MILLAPSCKLRINFYGSSVTQSVVFFTYNQSEKKDHMIFLVMTLPRYFLMQRSRKSNADVISNYCPPYLHNPDESRMSPFFSASLHSRKGTPSTQSRCPLAERGLPAQCQSPRCAFQVQQRTSAWPSTYHNHLLYKDHSSYLKAYTSVSSEKMTFATFQ